MNEIKIGILYFSPTNTTKKICKAIASGMGSKLAMNIDISDKTEREIFLAEPRAQIDSLDYLVVGAPVYNGKLPLPVIDVLQSIKGKGQKCTAVVLYGNRDYGIALHHMVEMLIKGGFRIISSGAFIGQHSYSDIIPVAIGRPDEKDLIKAKELGKKNLTITNYLSTEDIPRQLDFFSKSKSYTPIRPVFIQEKCSDCTSCSKSCPVGIISDENGDYLSSEAKNLCLGCMACVRQCSKNARIAKPNFIDRFLIKYVLKDASRNRLEPISIYH
jgi:Pyruvate/2-oxoacid:ferredoxin oxidoreductase delta subunit/flavodoxin